MRGRNSERYYAGKIRVFFFHVCLINEVVIMRLGVCSTSFFFNIYSKIAYRKKTLEGSAL